MEQNILGSKHFRRKMKANDKLNSVAERFFKKNY